MRRLAIVTAIVAVALVLIPYAIAPFYRFIDPVSTLMIWRRVTGARVERVVVPLNHISPALPLAVIVAEDGSFCHNRGIDLGAMREALRQSGDIGAARGASTLTQQTAKNLFLCRGAALSARRSKFRWRSGSTSCCRNAGCWKSTLTSSNGVRTANSAPRLHRTGPSTDRRTASIPRKPQN